MKYSVRSLESCMSESFRRGGQRNGILVTLLGTKTFPKIGDFIRAKLAVVKKLCTIFAHESQERFHMLHDESVTKEFSKEGDALIGELVVEVSDKNLTAGGPGQVVLREDQLCQICMLIGAVRGIFKDLRLIQHRLLRDA